jgi:predicted DNA-binding antitoxin AbrB/MazE fold protein
MSTQIRAIYEHGVFRPLESVDLPERQEVTVTIDGNGANSTERADHVRFFLPPDRWQTFCEALDAPSKEIPALRELFTQASPFDDASASAKSGPA